MQTIKNQQITAVILAGGRSSRMNGKDKGLIKLNKKYLVQHVIDAIKNQIDNIYINANRNIKKYQEFTKNPIISDDIADFQGPLAGFAKAMKTVKTPYLFILPCDCPLIDGEELLHKLKSTMIKDNTKICVAHDSIRLQPTFALLATSLLDDLLKYIKKGNRKIDLWYQQQQFSIADLTNHKQKFYNLNCPEDYALITKPSTINNVPTLNFIGFSGAGKTTLITKIIANLGKKKNIAYIKHSHHDFVIDYPNKDSYKCYNAGASQVIISSSKKLAFINRYKKKEKSLEELLNQLELDNLDLILVEGFKNKSIKKIKLQRNQNNSVNTFLDDENIIAVISDTKDIECDLIVLDINDDEQIINFVSSYMK
jgi:molybdenum cofactor guanylyltransferase/molybdopterin-guanine dinucleotide biosynthesis protein MobB